MIPEAIPGLGNGIENTQMKNKPTQGTKEQIDHFLALLHGEPVIDTPEGLLGIQSGVAKTTIKIDLLAKITGVMGQGINKLVSMQ